MNICPSINKYEITKNRDSQDRFKSCTRFNIDPDKCILLSGPVGCGKTSLLKILHHIVRHQESYDVIPIRNITFSFNNQGYNPHRRIRKYKIFFLRRFKSRNNRKTFRKRLQRHGHNHPLQIRPLPKNQKHASTNLTAQELEDRYCNCVRSRMRQLFNLIAFDNKTLDKRC